MYNFSKGFLPLIISGLLSCNAYADEDVCQNPTDCLPKIAKYIKNLGLQFGYQLSTQPSGNVNDQLLNPGPLSTFGSIMIQAYLGALTSPTLGLGSNSAIKYFLISPANAIPSGAVLNQYSNKTFERLPKTSYSSNPSESKLSSVTTNLQAQIDQQPYQVDPVTQTLLNFITTPPTSFCLTQNQSDSAKNCLPRATIINNAVSLPTPLQDLYKFDNVYPTLPQVNANTLITPLIISSQPSSPTINESNLSSITADQASAFIRNVSDTMIPLEPPDYKNIATVILGNKKDTIKMDAMYSDVKLFVAGMNTYLAQVSVGLSNLYYILSKRIEQTNGKTTMGSSAYNEYKMATYRLFNASGDDKATPWINQINTASSATVQKEIAILLAEINYQMYLSREQQERLLLTNSVLLLMNTKTGKPDAGSLVSSLNQASQGSNSSE